MEITNQLKKYVRSLHASKHRQKYNKFIAEGPKICEEFLSSKKYQIEYLFCTADFLENHPHLTHTVSSEKRCIVKERELSQLSCLKTANKVLLVLETRMSESPDFSVEHWSLYLDRIQDPGNMGTLIRIADWYGISAVYASPDSVSFYNPKVVQASMGAHNRVELVVLPSGDFGSAPFPKYGLSLDGKDIASLNHPSPGCIVVGNESKGISEEIKSHCTELLTIPRRGQAESLNAAVATGIACHLLIMRTTL